jgi:uncharacterized protein (TIGR00296 family)
MKLPKRVLAWMGVDGNAAQPSAAPLLATRDMCCCCFRALEASLVGGRAAAPVLTPFSARLPAAAAAPLFVSFKTVEGDLRGCIGTFAAAPLLAQLVTTARSAAFSDSRFAPVTAAELPTLSCTVSVLHSFEPAAAWDDWAVGKHGVTIRYTDRGDGGERTATFLPAVAPAQGWDHRATLQRLVWKAGGADRSDAFLRSVAVERYQDSACSLTYDEYLAMCKAP